MRIFKLSNKFEGKIIIKFSFNLTDNNSLKCNKTDILKDDLMHLFQLSPVWQECGWAERLKYSRPKFGHVWNLNAIQMIVLYVLCYCERHCKEFVYLKALV